MNDIHAKIRQMQFNVANVKLEFENAIADQSVPLDTRWNVFINAPEYIKNIPYSMCSGWDKFFTEDYVMYDGPYHVERYEFVCAADVIEHAVENCEDGEELPFDINEAKEKILAANLHGAKYDW